MKLEVKGVYFSYSSIDALKDVTMEVTDGEIVSIVGPNGSGKSTLLKCINRILNPKIGTILINGKNIKEHEIKELARLFGYVPQNDNYVFPFTVFEIVLLGRKPHVNWRLSAKDKEIVYSILELMGLEKLAFRPFNELSSGEKQKVLLARALAQEPEILLLDEPTSNLDLRHQLEILNFISAIVKKKGISAIMAMHDLNLAFRFSTQTILLKQGKIYAAGKPNEIFTEENIKAVYGVEVIIHKNSEIPYLIPVRVTKEML